MFPIRIMLVDDHAVLRDGLATMLDRQEDFHVVGQAGNGREAVERTPALAPDVILIDLRMPEMDGVEAMRRIAAERPEARFIVFTTYDTDEYIFDAIAAGARGFLLKDASREELFEAVRAVYRGESGIQPRITARILDRFSQGARRESDVPVLSERETAVLRLMATGAANKEIAAKLSITEHTVKSHVANIFQKLDAAGRTDAVTKGLRLKIIDL